MMPPSLLSCVVKNPSGNSAAGETAHWVPFPGKEKKVKIQRKLEPYISSPPRENWSIWVEFVKIGEKY